MAEMSEAERRAHEAVDAMYSEPLEGREDDELIAAAHAAITVLAREAHKAGMREGSECTATPGCPHPANYCDGCHDMFSKAGIEVAHLAGRLEQAEYAVALYVAEQKKDIRRSPGRLLDIEVDRLRALKEKT